MTQPTLFDVPVAPPRPNPVKVERDRLNAAALRVLARLQQGPAFNWELCQPEVGGLRAIGRVFELKQDGWDIEKSHVEAGTWRYTLRGRRNRYAQA